MDLLYNTLLKNARTILYFPAYFLKNCHLTGGETTDRRKIGRTAVLAAGTVLGSWLFLRFLGPVLLPFGVGLAAASAVEPAVGQLRDRLRLPRWLAAGICVTVLYGAVALLLYVLCRVLCREAAGFARTLPALARSLEGPAQALEQRLLQLSGRFPDGVGLALREGIREFFRSGAGLAARAYEWVFDFASGLLRRIPDLALFLLTAVLSSFMLASELPRLRALWRKKAPEKWQSYVHKGLGRVKTTLGGWLKAQVKLMLICALVLTAGFLILGVDYPLLFGMVIALIDALPVLGTGMVLIPWGLWSFLQGNSFLGVGLLCLYGAAALTRTALEPRMVGKQIGLDPLVTLLALYAGYRIMGVGGMILFPLGALFLKQFWSHMEKKFDNPAD